uniref:Glycosyl transferase CAP10 domain-containing protein n=1 Tax=viral metagenome TaxID=1070528 RepID=A0A6M3L683_9ZZZZ
MNYIYDPPNGNSYLTTRYFIPMIKSGLSQVLEGKLEDAKNKTILLLGIHLNPENIVTLKNNGNKIVSFDINDNSAFTYTYVNTKEVELIDVVFKVGGIQKTQCSNVLYISKDLEYTIKSMPFLNDDNWAIYCRMKQEGRLLSLPYHPTMNHLEIATPFENRFPTCLIRGGNHFLRYHLYLNLLKRQLAGEQSEFFAKAYSFAFCDDCKKQIRERRHISYEYCLNHKWECVNEHVKWQEAVPDYNINHAHWNNRCIPMYYWLTEQFQKTHGPVNMTMVESALNGEHRTTLRDIMGNYLFYGDLKWTFSIYAPPRFWESAQSRTINLVPRVTNDQDYFPEIKEFDHYITYSEDFSDLDTVCNVTKEQYYHITQNCIDLYHNLLNSPRLYDYIIERINNV